MPTSSNSCKNSKLQKITLQSKYAPAFCCFLGCESAKWISFLLLFSHIFFVDQTKDERFRKNWLHNTQQKHRWIMTFLWPVAHQLQHSPPPPSYSLPARVALSLSLLVDGKSAPSNWKLKAKPHNVASSIKVDSALHCLGYLKPFWHSTQQTASDQKWMFTFTQQTTAGLNNCISTFLSLLWREVAAEEKSSCRIIFEKKKKKIKRTGETKKNVQIFEKKLLIGEGDGTECRQRCQQVSCCTLSSTNHLCPLCDTFFFFFG